MSRFGSIGASANGNTPLPANTRVLAADGVFSGATLQVQAGYDRSLAGGDPDQWVNIPGASLTAVGLIKWEGYAADAYRLVTSAAGVSTAINWTSRG